MSRSDAFYDIHATFINAALISAHANHGEHGFRQKDVKFYIELLTNWMESSFKGPGLMVVNVQIQRLLDGMSEKGIVKKSLKDSRPIYKFTSIGLLEVTSQLVDVTKLNSLNDFFFLYHFVSLYSQKIEEILSGQRQNLPKSYQLEIKHLLNPQNLVERQRQLIEYEISKLKDRIDEAYKMTALAKSLLEKGKGISDAVSEVEKAYPYQLNNQRKMSEVFKILPPDVQLIEISEAPAYRAKTLWTPLLEQYESFLGSLTRLR